jgi:hypothetical protein
MIAIVASWFETRGLAALLTMRVWDETMRVLDEPHPEEARSAVSKDAGGRAETSGKKSSQFSLLEIVRSQ